MLSFPFNSSTTVFYYNKDAFKAAGSTRTRRPAPGPKSRWRPPSSRPAATSARLTIAWQGWTQLESFSAWHNVEFATKATACAAWMPA
jgi:sn-glycerol 3-phosphate transport system substrate-binding protein